MEPVATRHGAEGSEVVGRAEADQAKDPAAGRPANRKMSDAPEAKTRAAWMRSVNRIFAVNPD